VATDVPNRKNATSLGETSFFLDAANPLFEHRRNFGRGCLRFGVRPSLYRDYGCGISCLSKLADGNLLQQKHIKIRWPVAPKSFARPTTSLAAPQLGSQDGKQAIPVEMPPFMDGIEAASGS
jgi:hypothetical protein